MVLLLAIILILLGILVFALRGFFGVFPDSWEWTGIVLAGVGIVMAAPSILQMALGRAKLVVEFDRIVHERERVLAVYFKNPPIQNKIWKKLWIRRDTIQSLLASFSVSEVGSGNILVPICNTRIVSDSDIGDEGSFRVSLPPTYSVSAVIAVVKWDNSKKGALTLGDRTKKPQEIPPGRYRAQIIVTIEGEPLKFFRQFVVGDKADDLVWLKY